MVVDFEKIPPLLNSRSVTSSMFDIKYDPPNYSTSMSSPPSPSSSHVLVLHNSQHTGLTPGAVEDEEEREKGG